jgi:hypothetical protein
MGCFWITNPFNSEDDSEGWDFLNLSLSFHCADCNYLDCDELGGIWMPIPCNHPTFTNRRGADKAYEIVDCPVDSDGGIGYCCVPGNPTTGPDGESQPGCVAHGPMVSDPLWCIGLGGRWISSSDWPQESGVREQEWAREQCNLLCAVTAESIRGELETMTEEALEKLLEVLQTGLPEEPTRTAFNGPWKMRDTDKTIKQYYKDDIVTWAGKTYKVIQDVKAKHPSNTPSSFLLIEDKNAQVDGGLF